MLRTLRYYSLLLARRYPRSSESMIARFLRSDLVHWDISTVPRGVAVGMFWTFIPIPFQMIPATLFCWMVRGNLPVAILLCWITNPLTLPPVLLLEYRIGQWVLDAFRGTEQVAGIVEATSAIDVFAGGLQLVLVGGLTLSCTAMIAGYLLVWLAFRVNRDHRPRSKASPRRRGSPGAPGA